MRNFTYAAKLMPDQESAGFVVTFRDIPEAITQGVDLADAIFQAGDCLEEAIAGRLRMEETIPQPSRSRKGEHLLPLPALMAAKAALHIALKESGMTRIQLAKRLKGDEKQVRRLLDPRHNSQISRIEQALEALGQQLIVGCRAA
jgi:antitoxin HicB